MTNIELLKAEKDALASELLSLQQKNIQLRKRIKKVKDALVLIVDIAFDYDGFHSVTDLKKLVDELRQIAIKALKED